MSSYKKHNLGGGQAALADYEEMRDDRAHSHSDAAHDIPTHAETAPAVPTAIVIEYLYTRAAAALAVVYAGAFLWTLFLSDYFGAAADVTVASWPLRESPQPGIAVCLIFAPAFLWLWRRANGKALALATYLLVVWQYYGWYDSTKQIKLNIGSEAVKGAGWIGRSLYGAGTLDALTLLAVLTFIGLSIYLLVQNLTAPATVQRPEAVPRPFIDRVNGYGARHH